MNGFSSKQVRALRRKLDRRHVQSRQVEGRSIDYVEGWFAIAQANAIFGFDGWDREMTYFERLYERSGNERTNCGYLARIRIRVRAGENMVIREGTGWGSATASTAGDAHERALKAAETDATKRALATFGNRFGLSLYDKEQNGVTPKKPSEHSTRVCLYQPDGGILADDVSPEGFCSGLRQLIEKMRAPLEMEALLRANHESLVRLRAEVPSLKTAKGIHYADVLQRLAKERINTELSTSTRSEPEAVLASKMSSSTPNAAASNGGAQPPALESASLLKPSKIASGPRINKSELTIGTERRYRDKAHLQFVASQPCLVCGRQPTHAHHLTFAQKRGLAMKVSDEFTVPLCAVHHDEVHRSAGESRWWSERKIEPLGAATDLWTESRHHSDQELQAPSLRISTNGL